MVGVVELQAELAAEPAEVGAARRMLRRQLDSWGVSGDAEDVAVLLVSELVTNAILHGEPPLRLVASQRRRRIRVEVHDADATSVGRLRRRHAELEEGTPAANGRGLRLVDALSSRWGSVESEAGKMVWFEVDLP